MTRSRSFKSKKNFHKNLLKKTKGFKLSRKNNYSVAIRAYIKSLVYSTIDRKKRGCVIRRNKNVQLSYLLNQYNVKYNMFLYLLKKKCIIINRYNLIMLLNNNKYKKIMIKLFSMLK